MRACKWCGETGGTRIGGPCISCEYDDFDCDHLVENGRRQAEDETVAAIVAWMRARLGPRILKDMVDAVERKDWKSTK